MNRKLFLSIATLAIVVVSGYNMYRANINSVKLSDLALANVVALTNGEGTPVGICFKRDSGAPLRGRQIFCDNRTNDEMIYPCPSTYDYDSYSEFYRDRCTK